MAEERCKITLSTGATHEGAIFCIDPVTLSIVLKDGEEYTIVNPEMVSNFEGDLSKVKTPSPAEIGLSVQLDERKVAKMEHDNLAKAEEELDSINFSVDSAIQTLFDKLRILYPCRWSGSDMIILDSIKVSPPYNTATSINEKKTGVEGLDRISMVLKGERRKLGLD